MALVMVMAMGITVFADGSTAKHTITIENTKSGHTYEAYQIFAGNVSEAGVLTNVQWGKGVDTTKAINNVTLMGALKATTDYSKCNTAQDVATTLAGFADDDKAAKLDAFAEIVGDYLTETTTNIASTSTAIEVKNDKDEVTGYQYVISVTGDGYYLVKDKDDSLKDTTSDAYTKYIMKVVNNVTVKAKADAPTIDKVIVENSTDKEYNDVSIGDVINYKVTSRVPNMDGYNKYYFVVNDTMSKGLSFNDDIVIKIGDKTLAYTVENGVAAGTNEFVVTPTTDDTTGITTIEIVIKNFIQYNNDSYIDKPIVITYSATLNENAVIASTGNPNKVDLTYSNNPNYNYQGEDKPSKDEPTGKTPESKTITYVEEIAITKEDATNSDTKLAGATFKIEGTALNTVLVTGEEYVKVEDVAATDNLVDNNVYYKLNDGTYTTTDPTGNNVDTSKYESTSQKYKLRKVEKKVIKPSTVNYEVTSDSDGILKFTGLSEGTYKITEVQAPTGYNKLEDSIFIKIGWTAPTSGSETSTWTANYIVASTDKAITDIDFNDTTNNKIISVELNSDGTIPLKIGNNKGTVLPETGGTGVKVLYTVGAILAIGAAVLLITRRRMKMMEK
jgi:fimbrial isopeptide formation D2 family protein/LPXTG-motif cell wall-anchored protein